MHVPEGQKIPAKKLASAAHSSNPTMRHRANLAKTLKGMHKADGGPAGRDDDLEASPTLPPNGLSGPIKIRKPRPPKPQTPGPTTQLPPNEWE